MNHDDHINNLIKLIKSQCVELADGNNYHDAIKWCEANIGEQRLFHPLNEAEEGYIDYFEGEWAISTSYNPMFSKNIEVSFWIAQKQDRIQFQLMFG